MRLYEKIILHLLRYPGKYFIASLLSVAVFSIGLKDFKASFSTPAWFSENSSKIQGLKDYKKTFNDKGINYIAIGIKLNSSEFNSQHFQKMATKLSKLKYITSVTSVTNDPFYRQNSNKSELIWVSLSEQYPTEKDLLKALVSRTHLENYLFSKDLKFFMIYAGVDDTVDDQSITGPFIQSIEDLLSKLSYQDYEYSILGTVQVTDTFRKFAHQDNLKIMPAMFIAMVMLLYWKFRNIFIVSIALTIIGLCNMAAFGLLSTVGFTYNNITSVIPGVLLAVGLADNIHILLSFFKNKKTLATDVALRNALTQNFLPTGLTTLTTSLSFLSVSFTELIPIKSFGMIASFGTIYIWYLTYTLLPWVLLKFDRYIQIKEPKTNINWSTSIVHLIQQYYVGIILVFVGLIFTGGYFASKVQVNSDLLKYFPESAEINQTYQYGKKKMENGFRRFPLVLDTGQEDGIFDLEHLKRVDQFREKLLSRPEVVKILSVLDAIKQMNQVIHGEYSLPKDQQSLEKIKVFMLQNFDQLKTLNSRVSSDFRYLKLRVIWSVETTKEGVDKSREYLKMAKDKFNLKTKIGGFFTIYTEINQMVVDAFSKSMISVILLVFLIMLMVFRNLFYSLLAMLPNMVPVIIALASIHLMGVSLNIGTSIVSAICLGIAVDDTIHFMTHFLRYKTLYPNHTQSQAIEHTFQQTGEALSLTTLVLVISFGCFAFANFLPNMHFGILTAIGLIVALGTDLLFLPALLLAFNSKRQ